MAAPTYTQYFWAKSDRESPQRIHLLEHHMADVGACFEALLAQPTIRQRLAQSGDWEKIDDVTAARLCVFTALHDIGKVNLGFQTQIWPREDIPGGRLPLSFHSVGHTRDLTPILNCDDRETAAWFFDALGWWDGLLTWDDRDGATVCALFIAALSHHGRPLPLQGKRDKNPQIWQRFGELNPEEYTRRIGWLVKEKWFPAAFASDAPPLPSTPAFQHHFLGLCNLADWIGSNELWFRYVDEPQDDYIDLARKHARNAVDAVGLNLTGQREWGSRAGVPGVTELFPHIGQANAIQQATQDAPLKERLVIIESETGSGKTEAALWRFARMYEAGLVDGLYFALPTRAAAHQIHGRVRDFIANLFEEHRPPVVLAVPGYNADADAADIAIPDYNARAAGHHDDDRPWASENPKRYLAAQIAVGTVDQALLGALKVKNAHMRTACLARNLLVVDEVHASDTYMGEILAALLDAHLSAGGYALLMSATLGSVARRRWLGESAECELADAIDVRYPVVSMRDGICVADFNGQDKEIDIAAMPIMRDFDAVAQRALDAARTGTKVLVIRNTVHHAINTWQTVGEQAENDTPILLHHSRFAAGDRHWLDGQVTALLGRDNQPEGGCVVVGTQTLEQSLDIDADLLITDLCPMDVLLQRIGRLHRHHRDDRPAGYEMPACIVLTPAGDDLSPLLASGGQNANGLGPHGGVYEDLRILQATLGLIAEHSQWRIPEMNRKLVERATHPHALEAVEKMGDEWKEHGIKVKGGEIGEWQTARGAIIRWDKSFFEDNGEVCFPSSSEERIRTRLGDDRIDIAFDPPPVSPFDPSRSIDKLAVPVAWLKGQEVPETVETTTTEGGFDFSVGDRKFRYNRKGLRRA